MINGPCQLNHIYYGRILLEWNSYTSYSNRERELISFLNEFVRNADCRVCAIVYLRSRNLGKKFFFLSQSIIQEDFLIVHPSLRSYWQKKFPRSRFSLGPSGKRTRRRSPSMQGRRNSQARLFGSQKTYIKKRKKLKHVPRTLCTLMATALHLCIDWTIIILNYQQLFWLKYTKGGTIENIWPRKLARG